MAQDTAYLILGYPSLLQYRSTIHRMLVESWMDFPVKIVEQPYSSPTLFIFTIFPGIGPHSGLDRQHMPYKTLIFDKLCDQIVRRFPIHYLSPLTSSF